MSHTVTLVAVGARTASGVSAAVSPTGVGDRSLHVAVNVSAVSGTTPTLTLTLEWSHDGTTWHTGEPADTFAQVTAAAAPVKTFTVKGPQVRVRWAIAGTTPSFTFEVLANAN